VEVVAAIREFKSQDTAGQKPGMTNTEREKPA